MKSKHKAKILAESPKAFVIQADANVEIVEADAASGAAKRTTFRINAYNGGAMSVGYGAPVVIDLAGLRTKQRIPILLDHDHTQIIGQSERVDVSNGQVNLSGHVTGDDEHTRKVISHARGGFVWGASIGVHVHKMERIGAGEHGKVNGLEFTGPVLVVRTGRLGEVSFVATGADENAEARVAARSREVSTMDFDKWLVEKGFPNATAAQRKTLRATFDAEVAAQNGGEGGGDGGGSGGDGGGSGGDGGDGGGSGGGEGKPPANRPVRATGAPDPVAVQRQTTADELDRQSAIMTACGENRTLAARAIREGWDAKRTELEARIEALPKAPAAIIRDNAPASAQVLECAIRLSSAEPRAVVEAAYTPQILEAADVPNLRRLSLRGLVQAALAITGISAPAYSAGVKEWVRAAFSTATLPGILGNTANKILQAAFLGVPSAARIIAKKLTANDFKTHTGYRLGGKAIMEEVGPGGELKHGTLSETSFTYEVGTHGEYLGLTRQQWKNDDLGAFTQIPTRIGRGAALALEKKFWDLVIANTNNFFHANNKNLITGADTVLGLTGMDKAVQTLLEMVDDQSQPILISGKFLVVPPALAAEARRLFVSDVWIPTGVANASKREAAANTYRGAYEPVVAPHLKALTTAWYLFGDPNDVAAFGIAYLDGVETPTVEEVDPPPDMLGMAWRGFIDFGVCQIDKQGAVKSAGA